MTALPPTAETTPTQATAESSCVPDAAFVADVSIPDDTGLAPGDAFTKTWRILNSGTCDWIEGYKLVFLAGDMLGTDGPVSVLPTAVGNTVDIPVDMVAPMKPGTYTSLWQLQAPDGTLFGVKPYVRIIVISPSLNPYPGVSGITAHSREIFLAGQGMGNRLNVFSKVGDSTTFEPQFLFPIGEGRTILHDHEYLQPVIDFFLSETARTGNSFNNYSLAVYPGWKSSDLLNPGEADASCNGLSPLECEYSYVKPSIAVIMIGINDCTAHVPLDSFESNLNRIVAISVEKGIIPVLSTIPRNGLCNAQDFNAIISSTASFHDIPLVDYWSMMENAPNHGVGEDGVHPSLPPDGNAANFSQENLSYGYTIRNLLTLQMLDALWRQVISY